MRRVLSLLITLTLAGCGAPATTPVPPPGELIGSVQISSGVADGKCLVLVEGLPLSSPCDESGQFDLRNVPPGRWNLRILDDATLATPGTTRIAVGSNSGQVSNLGALALEQPGSIGGHVKSTDASALANAIIGVPDIGSVTTANADGGYLLVGVAPGTHDVVLLEAAGSISHPDVGVQPAKVTIGADLDLSMLEKPTTVAVAGFAARSDAGSGAQAGITIELVEDLNGTIVASATSNADGSFTLQAPQGTYILRAHDGKNPITAIVPSLIVHGQAITVESKLTIPPQNGDLDGDGIPNGSDPDVDGDGVANGSDAFPFDPAETKDSDGDGVGDRSDLRSKGGQGIDTDNPTPDTDGDGLFDFEDDCPLVPNPDQWDPDGDGVGTVKDANGVATNMCDNCPFVFNPDQKDSLGNGTGDACRSCRTNQDCPAGKICGNGGQCVGCLTNAQCGDEICNVATGGCQPCAQNSDCTAPQLCAPDKRCVQCLSAADCIAGDVCVAGSCTPACSIDAQCAGGFCVSGACVSCRSTADCPSTEWCDNGACKAQCTVDGDCTGGRVCDQTTRTCVLPCAGGCTTGQTCVSNVCRDACDASHPCGAGLKCSAGACVPQCATDNDCLSVAPHTVCQAGACVPNGQCTFDADCPTTQLCLSGTCAPRGGTFTTGKGYSCSTACDCRQGETCAVNTSDNNKYCVADAVPTWFVAAGTCTSGTCDGKTPSGWSNDLTGIVAGAVSGDVIAVHAGDTLGAATIAQPGVTLAGGFSVCAANRWVRDRSQRSTTGALSVPGTIAAPLANVVIENVNVSIVNNGTGNIIDANYADGLTVNNVNVTNTPASNATAVFAGVSCTDCNNVAWSNITMPGVDGSGGSYTVTVARLAHGSGTIANVTGGPVYANVATGISVSDTTGPVTISGATLAQMQQGYGGNGIVVTNGTGGLVTISNNSVGFSTSAVGGNGGAVWIGISVSATPAATVSGNTVDGRGITDAGSGTWTERDAVRFSNSSGTLSGNDVYFPVLSTVSNVYGYRLLGPTATISFTNNTSSLGSATGATTALDVENITSGAVTVGKSSLQSGSSNAGSVGLNWTGNDVTFAITDTTFGTGTGGGNGVAAQIVNGVGRLERCKLTTAGNRGLVYALQTSTTQLEVYDSWFFAGGVAGGSGGSTSDGWEIDSGSSIFGVNNTIDGGGSTGDGYPSNGVLCSNSQMIMNNNLINGGSSPSVRRLNTTAVGSCFIAGNWAHNYFWYSSSSTPDGGDQANNLTTNNFLGSTTCYDDINFTQPDYHIAAGSFCVDRAQAPTRKDGSTITVDIDGNARLKGGAVDIGCHEVE
jgi:hypothetical protein